LLETGKIYYIEAILTIEQLICIRRS